MLPEPERSPGSLITSMVVNGLILAFLFYIGATAKKAIDQHRYEETLLVLPAKPEPPPPEGEAASSSAAGEIAAKVLDVKLEAPKINMPKPEPKPDPKPIPIEVKLPTPVIQSLKPKVIEAPQPKPC